MNLTALVLVVFRLFSGQQVLKIKLWSSCWPFIIAAAGLWGDMAGLPHAYGQLAPPASSLQPPQNLHKPHATGDEVRTIFIVGLPPDVKEIELQNMLKGRPGYEASQLTFRGGHPMGFALFTTAALAMAARDSLQNSLFRANGNNVLKVEMAKKNLYVKPGVTGVVVDGTPFDQNKRMRTSGDYISPGPFVAPGPFVPPASLSWGLQGYGSPATPYDPYVNFGMGPVQPVAPVQPFSHPVILPVAPAGYAPVQNVKDNPPCNTLFIGNLGENTSEAELRGIFGSQPGFCQMKVLRQGKSTVCFIEYTDVSTAMMVHKKLQGALLSTSDRGGMRIQFSKNPFGKRKNAQGYSPEGGAPGVSSTDGNLPAGFTGHNQW